ncbi:DUF1054 domain-containing protein [Candidatus Pseudothioglobus singularis]|nr:DUF1054 domain-containing protein [Candidatus Pseudothioglobus singularis]
MDFQGFQPNDFDTFLIDGLPERMKAIQTRIQPKFKQIGSELVGYLSAHLGNEVYLHIARHARRKVNPPNDTWLAIADNKRGYKKHPHFQVGLFDDRIFIWLALIYEVNQKQEIAEKFLANFDQLKQLPDDFVVSFDHMKKDAIPVNQLEVKHLERFRDVKKAELLIGKHLLKDDPIVSDGKLLIESVKETYQSLLPFYRMALQA